jgi:hypothetical protein
MKKLTTLFVLAISLLAGSAFAKINTNKAFVVANYKNTHGLVHLDDNQKADLANILAAQCKMDFDGSLVPGTITMFQVGPDFMGVASCAIQN